MTADTCRHCGADIVRPATRWLHKVTGHRPCGPSSRTSAEPQSRVRSRADIANDPGWRQVAALYANGSTR